MTTLHGLTDEPGKVIKLTGPNSVSSPSPVGHIEFTANHWPLQFRASCACGAVVETFDRTRSEVWMDTHKCEVAS